MCARDAPLARTAPIVVGRHDDASERGRNRRSARRTPLASSTVIGRARGILLWTVVLLAAVPSAASAAQAFSVSSPTGFPAGGHPTYTTTITLDTSAGTPSKVNVSLQPGVLASVSANPSCVTGTPRYVAACQIGTGSAATSVPMLTLPLKAYLVPPPTKADLVGIDLVTDVPNGPVTHAGGQLVQTASGGVATVLSLDLSSLGGTASLLTQMSLTINGTLGGKPFTRMPTNCHPGISSVTIVYTNRTVKSNASPDFAPTGCRALPFAPKLSGTAVVDAHDTGVAVTTTVTQAADEAASASTQLSLPWPTLAPNFTGLGLQGTGTPVGSATTATPLLPSPLQGEAFLTGQPWAPTMTLRFPPPAVLTLVGSIDLARHTVTFPTIPDVPVTRLTVTLFGGRAALLSASCDHPIGTLGGALAGQNGAKATVRQRLTLAGCPGRPTLSAARFSGLGAGTPAVGFTVASGHAAPKLRALTVALPAGLTLVRSQLRAGVHVPALRSLAMRGGRLVIRLKRPLAGVAVRIGGRALHETRRLRRQKHRRLVLRVTVTDASGTTTPLSAKRGAR